jgi:tRNA nucleotidyltransferase (CCA-adding enzyme)
MAIVTTADLQAFADKKVNLSSDEAQKGRDRVNFLRERLEKHIKENPGFSLVKMLHAGSVAKGTALSKVNDMDVAVYVRADAAPATNSNLVTWMADRIRDAYGGTIDPNQVREGTNCPTITFASGLSVDVVPVLYEGEPDDRGCLVAKATGDRLETSVKLHLEFVRKRKNAHPHDFAQVVRLVKWWIREQKSLDDNFKFKSFIAELLVAKLADDGGDMSDYPEALAQFFNYVVESKLSERIAFSDYYAASELPAPSGNAIEIFDPVNPENNVSFRYSTFDRDRILVAAEKALDAVTEASFATTKGEAVACWQVVLGTTFKG